MEQAGYQVSTAADGVNALEVAHREKPTLIVLDLMLPGIDGLEVPFARAAQPFFALMLNRTLSATIQTQQEQQKAEEHSRCRQVLNALNERSRAVLLALARGLHPHEVAKTLNLDQSTISYYTSKIYRECRNTWDVSVALFLCYLSGDQSASSPRKRR